MSHAVRPVRRRRRLRSASPLPAVPPLDLAAIIATVFYTEAETAHFLRLKSAKTLTVWRCRGEHPELRYVKRYGRVLYYGQAILDFLNGTATAPETKSKRGAK